MADAMNEPPPEAQGLEPHDPSKIKVPPHLTDCPEIRNQLAKYYNAYSVLDAQVGHRLKWLDDQGLRNNTIVIFLSDHGRGLPREKRWHYICNYAPKLPWGQCQLYMEQQPIMGVMREKFHRGELRGDELAFFQKTKPTEELYDTENDGIWELIAASACPIPRSEVLGAPAPVRCRSECSARG